MFRISIASITLCISLLFASPFDIAHQTSAVLQQPDVLFFRAGIYSSQDGIPKEICPELSFDGFTRDFGYYIVKFSENSTEEWKSEILNSQDSEIFYYVPTNSWIFKLENPALIENFSFVKAVIPLVPSLRVLPELITEKQLPDTSTGFVRLKISVFQGDDYLQLAETLTEMGANLIDASQGSRHEFIVIEIPVEKTRDFAIEIALSQCTEWVEREYPKIFTNDWSRWIVQSYHKADMESGSALYNQMSVDLLHVPIHRRNLYGQNQIVGYCDSGLDTNSFFFCDNGVTVPKSTSWAPPTDTGHRKIRAYNNVGADFDDQDSYVGGHGTHVGGSIAGNNEANNPESGTYDQADGMAPLAKLVFTDANPAGSSYIITPSDMNTLFGFARNCGAYIHSNSYGSSSPSYYNTSAQQCDEFMWDNKDFLIFFAAGNDNSYSDRVATYNCSKNIVSVGATEPGAGSSSSYSNPGSSSGANPEDMASFSSHGPTDEGLLKPNISVPGGWYIWSADNIDGGSACHSGIESMGGTSMACPTAAGMTALIRQYFVDGFYPSGSANAPDAITPSGALMKAMLINGTRNMTGAYTIDAVNNSGHQDAPSNGQGWGRVVLDDCMYFDDTYSTDDRKLFIEEYSGFTSSGQSQTYYLNTGTSTTEPLKIVLSYSDYPGSPSVGTSGVNDLNLEVVIDGNTYLGNNFASSDARSVTGGSIDQINRDEVIWLDAIAGQSFEITVTATTIRTASQPFALVVTGDIFEGSPNNRPEIPELTNVLFDNARTTETSPSIQFLVPSDDDGDPLHFQVQIDDDDDFLSPIAIYSSETDAGFSGLSFPTAEGTGALVIFTFPALTDGETYFWRVRGDDGVGPGNYTEARSFTVDTAVPALDWFQTIDPQFDRGTPSDVIIDSDKISVTGETVSFFDDFETDPFAGRWGVSGSTFYTWQDAHYYSPTHAVRMLDASTSTRSSYARTFTALTEGYASTWSMTQNASDECFIIALYYNSSTRITQLYYREGYIALWDGTTRHNLVAIDPGAWHHFRIDFNCPLDQVTVTIDDSLTFGPYTFQSSTHPSTNLIAQGTFYYFNSYTCDSYFDDVKVAQGGGAGAGTLYSPDIALAWVPEALDWNEAKWTQDTGDSIVLVVDKKISGVYIPFDSSITTGTTGTIDLAALGSVDTIRLRAKFVVKGSIEPDMYDWSVSYQRNEIGVDLFIMEDGAPQYSQWDLGVMPQMDYRIMTEAERVFVKNTGTVPIDISFSANTTTWTLDNWPGIDTCVVLALFYGLTAPTFTEFDTASDYLSPVFRLSGSADLSPYASPVANGTNILPTAGENLYMLFATPLVNNVPSEQAITITIQATP